MHRSNKVESNKVDLKEVNKPKSKKTLQMPQLASPLKKQKGPKRDEEGKFAVTTTSSGLKSFKTINLKRAFTLIAVIALVGGYFVYQSFAATSNVETAKQWYQSCQGLGKQADWDYWAGQISSRGQSAAWANFKTTYERNAPSRKCPASDPVAVSVNPNPPVTPTPNPPTPPPVTSGPLKDAQACTTLGAAYVANAKKDNDTTNKISLKSTVTRAELDSIGAKEKHFRGALGQMQTCKSTAQGLYNKAISNTATKSQGPAILAEVDKIQGHISSLAGYVQNIANDYQRAKVVYEKKQQVATRQVGGGSYETRADPQPTPPRGATHEEVLAFARQYCSTAPDYLKNQPISGGVRIEVRDIYYTPGHTTCNNKLLRVHDVVCNEGWQRSGNSCVREARQPIDTHPSYYSLPSLPLGNKTCAGRKFNGPGGGVRCIRNVHESQKVFSQGSKIYTTQYESCTRKWGGYKITDKECKWFTGEWRKIGQ